MALQASGRINASDINSELGVAPDTEHPFKLAAHGGIATINTQSGSYPNSTAPYKASEWYSYDHGASSGWAGTTTSLQGRWDARENLNTSNWSVASTDGGSMGQLNHQNSPTVNTSSAPYYVQYDGSNDRSTSTSNVYAGTNSSSHWSLTYWIYDTGGQSAGYERITGFSGYRCDIAESSSTHYLRLYHGMWRTTSMTVSGGWTHYAICYDASGVSNGTDFVKYYKDGELIQTGMNHGYYINNRNYALGAKPGGGENWNGRIGQFCIYYRALSQAEVTANHVADKGYWT